MITTFLLTILGSFLGVLLALLPVGHLSSSITSSVTNIWGFVNAFSYVIALDTLIQVVLLMIAFDLVLLLWHVINWIIRKIPGMQ
jgi:hypothetical protein